MVVNCGETVGPRSLWFGSFAAVSVPAHWPPGTRAFQKESDDL